MTKALKTELLAVLADLDCAIGYVACSHLHKDSNVRHRTDFALEALRAAMDRLERLLISNRGGA